MWSVAGVLLAVLETLEIISPIYGPDGNASTNAGTVSAGYQNFLVKKGAFYKPVDEIIYILLSNRFALKCSSLP